MPAAPTIQPHDERGMPCADRPVCRWIQLTLALFLLAAGVCGASRLFGAAPHDWPAALLLAFAVPASVAALAHHLPPLNVLCAGLLAAGVGALLTALDQATGLPFGGLRFTAANGPALLGLVPWIVPGTWFVIALTARGGARFLLHRQPPPADHGWRVLALAGVLGTAALLLLGRYAMRAGLLNLGSPTPGAIVAALLVANLLLQIFLTPLLLDKFPRPRPANPLPLLVLVPLIVLLMT